jgi:hypothetical protein
MLIPRRTSSPRALPPPNMSVAHLARCLLMKRRRFVSYAVQDVTVSREAFLASSQDWYKHFGYNPLTIRDDRLSYTAPYFSKKDWLLFCTMALSLDLRRNVSMPPASDFSRIFSGPSLAHQACVAFSDAASGKQFGLLPPCFEFTRTAPARDFRYAAHAIEEEYVRTCARYEEDGMEPSLEAMDPFRIRMMVCVPFRFTGHTSHFISAAGCL